MYLCMDRMCLRMDIWAIKYSNEKCADILLRTLRMYGSPLLSPNLRILDIETTIGGFDYVRNYSKKEQIL